MPKSRKFWYRLVSFASLLGAGSMAIDVPLHAWPQLGVSLGATGVTLLVSRKGFRQAERAEAHKPDYAKIARLEVELGLVPDPVAPTDFYAPPTPQPPPDPWPPIRPVNPQPPVQVPPPPLPRLVKIMGRNGVTFTYQGIPGYGNLIDWDATSSGMDPYGNWYTARPQRLRKPDHPCSLCIPGRPATNCPFNSVCQT